MPNWIRTHRSNRSDAGYTLIEMLVVMIVFGLAIAMIFQALVRTERLTKDLSYTADSASEVRQALATIDRQVRSGNVLYSPENEPAELASCTAVAGTNAGSCMRVYTQANGGQRCVQWQVLPDTTTPGSNVLRMRSWSPDWQTDGNYSSWAIVARGLSATANTPFKLQGASSIYSSRLLDVRFDAIDKRRKTGTTVISASLSGRNTNYGYDSGLCSPEPPAA